MRNRATTVRFPVFSGYEVRVILSANLIATGRRLGTDLSGCVGALVTQADSPKRSWLVLSVPGDPATIAHESSHAIRAMFRLVGAKADDESFAYHLDYLVGKIHKFLECK